MKIRAVLRDFSYDIAFLIREGNRVCQPIKLVAKEHPDTYTEPSFTLSPDEAQSLMDDLWQCGLRPSEGSGSAGALAATERHLKDMQKLVFDKGT